MLSLLVLLVVITIIIIIVIIIVFIIIITILKQTACIAGFAHTPGISSSGFGLHS
jgi:hypothetical protein